MIEFLIKAIAPLFAAIVSIYACTAANLAGTPASETSAQPPVVLEARPQKWQNALDLARKEGKAVLYAGAVSPTLRESVSKSVRNKFGIETNFVAGRGTEIAQKLIFERRSGVYFADMTIMGPDSALTLKENQVFASFDPVLMLPEVTDGKAWPAGGIPYFDKDRLLVPLTVGYQSYVIINSDLVKDGEIKSYLDLLDPRWKGKIVLSDPNVGGGSGINWVTFILKHAVGFEGGQQYLRQLATVQDLTITKDNRLQVEGTARGKWAIAIGPTVALVSEFIKAGAPIKWTRMKEGGSLAPTASVMGLVDKAANPNSAIVMVNWLLSAEGQAIFSAAFGQPATRSGIPPEGIEPGRVALPGEKTYLADEDFTNFSKDISARVAREIFK